MTKVNYAKNLRALADAVGVDRTSIAYHRKKGLKLTKTTRGYAVEPVQKWLARNVRPKSDSPLSVGTNGAGLSAADRYELRDELTRAQIRERGATASLKEIQLRLEHGELIPKDQVVEEELARSAVFKRALLSLGRSVAPLVVGLPQREVQTIIDKKCRDVLQRLAKM